MIMQQFQDASSSPSQSSQPSQPSQPGQPGQESSSSDMSQLARQASLSVQEAARAAERARLRQGIMHVRIRHFFCTLEETFDESLRGMPFVVGTGTGRPNEPGRVIDASPAAMRLGITSGMPLRRAHRIAQHVRFLPASYDRYQPVLQQLKERYRAYSRIVESIPIADSFIDLRGCEIPFESPVSLAERLCAEIADIDNIGLTALIGVANGKAIAELAALMSRKDGRQGVLYIPPGRESSFVQTLPLSMLLQMRTAGTGQPAALPELGEASNGNTRPPQIEGRSEQTDSVAVADLVTHLRDFGITSFAQVAALTEEGVTRRLGRLGIWVYQLANGQDTSLVMPDAPPLSQNARVRFHHAADADETCAAISKLAYYLGERLQEQRLRGKSVTLILWPNQLNRYQTRKLMMGEEGEEAVTTAEETVGGQVMLQQYSDDSALLARQGLMLFAHYHRPPTRYLQVQLRIGDIITATSAYYPPPARSRSRPTRKLGS